MCIALTMTSFIPVALALFMIENSFASSSSGSRVTSSSESDDCSSCVCQSHQGCCREHRSTCLPNPWGGPSTSETSSPPTSSSGIAGLKLRFASSSSSSKTMNAESRPLLEKPRAIETPSDPYTTYTLMPVHTAVACHIASENLDCVYHRLNPVPTLVSVKELCFEGSTRSQDGVRYDWHNEVYFYKGTFLQKQEIKCLLQQGNDPFTDQRFTGCPHQNLIVSSPVFKYNKMGCSR